eukprot:gb/GECG01008209.1/.p1 GENE.gb/GECG01008209.1/~~gb/GECG01008209.1/.p1  ORF type:complete len:627 (+),score=97.69 gb/GECG01008209.1/:1-1881(+)
MSGKSRRGQTQAQLNTAAHPWKRQSEDEALQEERKLTSILNKITIETFDKLSDQLIQTPLRKVQLLRKLVSLIIDKAEMEHHFGPMYAQLIQKLNAAAVNGTWKTPGQERTESFLYIVLDELQARFLNEELGENNEKALARDPEEQETIRRTRKLGHIQFLGELFKVGIVPEKVVHWCVMQLLEGWNSHGSRGMVEEHIELCIRLLSVSGKSLDNSAHLISRKFLSSYMDIFKHLAKLPAKGENESEENCGPLTNRVKFAVLDLLELRQLGWVPRRIQTKAKKLEDIHAEARLEELSKTDKNAAAALHAAQMKDTGEDEGWEVVGNSTASSSVRQKPDRPKGIRAKAGSKGAKESKGGSQKGDGKRQKPVAKKKTNTPTNLSQDQGEGKVPLSRQKFITVSCATCDEWINLRGDETAQKAVLASFKDDLQMCSSDDSFSALEETISEGKYPKLLPMGSNLSFFVEKTADHVLSNSPPGTVNDRARLLVELWSYLEVQGLLQLIHIVSGLLPMLEFMTDIKADVPKFEQYFALLLCYLVGKPDLRGAFFALQKATQNPDGYFYSVHSSGSMGTVLDEFIQQIRGTTTEAKKIIEQLISEGLELQRWSSSPEQQQTLLSALSALGVSI